MGRGTSSGSPLDLVWLSAVTWDFPLVGRTRMLTEAWRSSGRTVTFVQVPSLRSGLDRMTHLIRLRAETDLVRPWPPCPVSWWSHLPERQLRRLMRASARDLRRQLERHLDLSHSVALVVSPVWTAWLDALPFRSVVYDCIDDVDVQTPRADLRKLYRRWEDELVQRASAVVVSATELERSIRARREHVPLAVVRNGVNSEEFRRLGESSERPPDLPPAGARPLVGFVGAIYQWLDVDLVRRVAERMPGFDFVFVGPTDGRTTLPQLPNILDLGLRPYAEVPAYVAAFDVCWLPFRAGDVAASANPVKLYEYLALGKPVVATPVADTGSFEQLVHFGSNTDDICALLLRAVDTPVDGKRRESFADRNSWQQRAQSIAHFVDTIC